MKQSFYEIFLFGGLLLTLAAFPCFAQDGEVSVIRKPLQDLGRIVSQKIQNREVDLKTPFSLTFQAKLDEHGRFDPKTEKFTKSEGDEKIIVVAKESIKAVNDSGVFNHLKQVGLNEVEITLVQTDTEFSAILKSKLENANRAKSLVSMFNMAFQIGRAKEKDGDTKALLESIGVENFGEDFLLKFSMPLEQFHGIINKEVEKVKQ